MKYIKVKDKNDLIRDMSSNGVVNVDEKGYNSYIESYKRIYNQNNKIQKLENDIGEMKNDLNEIKDLLRSLANGS
jgi:acyl-[acyl carrier protein]--UDP-N-acetylglucosamine O-acyltransferase